MIRRFISFLILVLFAAVSILTGAAFFARAERESVREVLRLGMEDAAGRVVEARNAADIQHIVRTTRLGKFGRLTIRKSAGLAPVRAGIRHVVDDAGTHRARLETECRGYRLVATTPEPAAWIANGNAPEGFLVADILLLLLLIVALPEVKRIFHRDLASLRLLFTGETTRARSLRHMLTAPITFASLIAFVFAVALSWFVSNRVARAEAEEVLRSAARDMGAQVDACVDELLFYQGNAICSHYRTPQAVTMDAVQTVMHRYDLDELNVVDERGIVIAGALADVGYDMGSKPLTAQFNCLLHGAKTFAQPFRGAVEDPTLRRKYAGVAFPPPAKGYIQLGFAEHRVKDGIDYWFSSAASGRHIGETGFYVLAKEETGLVDSAGYVRPDGREFLARGETLANIGFDAASSPRDLSQFFRARLFGVECLCLSEVRNFHWIVTALPLREVNGGSVHTVCITSLILLVVLVVVVIFMTRLSDLVASLRGYIARERAQQDREFALARTIQLSSLPAAVPTVAGGQFDARMKTAREVGGDFYDFGATPSGACVFLIADVSGKGISAAMFMMRAKALVRAAIAKNADLAAAVARANALLAENNTAEMFVTAWIARFDPVSREIEYVNAGHNPPLVRRANGSVEWVRGRPGLPLAAMEGVRYRAERLTLAKGDELFLYTDGVTEAANAAQELYGEARLEKVLATRTGSSVAAVGQDLETFVAGADQADDITMLSLVMV